MIGIKSERTFGRSSTMISNPGDGFNSQLGRTRPKARQTLCPLLFSERANLNCASGTPDNEKIGEMTRIFKVRDMRRTDEILAWRSDLHYGRTLGGR